MIEREISRMENLVKDKSLGLDKYTDVAIKLRHYKEIKKSSYKGDEDKGDGK